MAKRVILAVAGAGKTYYICHEIDPKKRNLIVAFTHENIKNIQKELLDAYGRIPEMTKVMTYDSFIYQMLVRSFEPTVYECFGIRYDFTTTGITLQNPPLQRINVNGVDIPNRKYHKKDQLSHYMNNKMQYYCATLSELAMVVKKGQIPLVRLAAERLNIFFDQIMIDEFQDFREHDYELITTLSKYVNNILLVGDYYQHSVSGQNNSGKPFKKRKAEVCYSDFLKELNKNKYDIDEKTLACSRRCSEEVCLFIKKKLGIDISSAKINEGRIIRPANISAILADDDIMKLVYNKAQDYPFKAVNWSYSKGDTFDKVCVILNKSTDKLLEDGFSLANLKTITLNKLYVALTRSKGDLYIITSSEFEQSSCSAI